MRSRSVISIVLLALCAPLIYAQKSGPAKRIAPLVTDQAVAVGRVNLAKFDAAKLLQKMKLLGLKDAELKKTKRQLQQFTDAFRGVPELFVIGYVWSGPVAPFVLAAPIAKKAKAERIAKYFRKTVQLHVTNIGGFVVAGDRRLIQDLGLPTPSANPMLAKAFAAASPKSELQVVFVPSAGLRRTLPPKLPPALGGGKVADLVNDFRFVTLDISAIDSISLRVTAKAINAAAATRLKKLFVKVRALARKTIAPEMRPLFAKLDKGFVVKQVKDRLQAKLDGEFLTNILLAAVKKVRLAAMRLESQNNLMQLALSLHSFQDAYKKLPAAASVDRLGKPLLSWRVHILPFIGQDNLYKQFKLNEPWNSPHNKKLVAQMPLTFRSPFSKAKPGMTTYLAPVGKGTVFGRKALSLPKITVGDGTSNTLWLVEAVDSKAVIWTKPADLPIDAKKPHRGLRKFAGNVFLASFADGSTQAISFRISAEMLNRAFQWNDGKIVEFPK